MKEFNFRPVLHPQFLSLRYNEGKAEMGNASRRSGTLEAISEVTDSIRSIELDAVFRNWEDRLRRWIELDGEDVD
jgi:hypothetical protein